MSFLQHSLTRYQTTVKGRPRAPQQMPTQKELSELSELIGMFGESLFHNAPSGFRSCCFSLSVLFRIYYGFRFCVFMDFLRVCLHLYVFVTLLLPLPLHSGLFAFTLFYFLWLLFNVHMYSNKRHRVWIWVGGEVGRNSGVILEGGNYNRNILDEKYVFFKKSFV